ncbi:MAG: hypothetical protein PGN13_03010 [Patulibacter minatonensis]
MKRSMLVAGAALGGLALAGGVLVARDGSTDDSGASSPTPTSARPAAVHVDRAGKPMRVDGPAGIASTARIVARAADPAGGPDWVLRRYDRPSTAAFDTPRGHRAARTVRCAQLGRLVDGQVVWLRPGSVRAKPLPLGDAGTSSCTLTAPIAQRLGVSVGGFPDGIAGSSATRIRTAVLWGVVDRPVAGASIEHSQFAGPVDVRDGAFLRVARAQDESAPPYVRLTVRDRDGGVRRAIPLGAFNELPAPGRVRGAGQGAFDAAPAAEDGRLAPGSRFTTVSKLPADRLGVIRALYATRVAGHTPCVTDPVPTIGGRPVQPWVRPDVGLVHEPLLRCSYVRDEADAGPVQFGGSGSSIGIDTSNQEAVRADERARRVQRRPSAMANLTVATPPGTRFLEVTSPVGITTVRVSWARVTSVTYDGQTEVVRSGRGLALAERLRGGRIRRSPSLFTFRALDARGRQIGEPGRSAY